MTACADCCLCTAYCGDADWFVYGFVVRGLVMANEHFLPLKLLITFLLLLGVVVVVVLVVVAVVGKSRILLGPGTAVVVSDW